MDSGSTAGGSVSGRIPKSVGLAAAALGIALVGFILAMAYIDWRARQLATLTTAALHATSEMLPPDAPAGSGRYEIVRVPGRNAQECLRERNGVADQAYWRCYQGYSYRRYVP